MLTIFVSKRCIFPMSKVNEQLSKLASLLPCHLPFIEYFIRPFYRISCWFMWCNLPIIFFPPLHILLAAKLFLMGAFSKPNRKPLCLGKESVFVPVAAYINSNINNTYTINVNSRLTAFVLQWIQPCSTNNHKNEFKTVEFPYARQSIVAIFEAIQNTRSTRFIRSKTLKLRARVLNLIKRSYTRVLNIT